MAEIKASFFIECEELLEALQDGLQAMENGDSDGETINVIFRAVHSIKGGAGAFGLDQLVGFAHVFETTLDEVRAGRLEIDPEKLLFFLQCSDVLSDVVRGARDETLLDEADLAPFIEKLTELAGGKDDAGGGSSEPEPDFQPMSLDLDLPGLEDRAEPSAALDPLAPGTSEEDTAETGKDDVADGGFIARHYQITFAPVIELYESGNEPLQLFKTLATLGKLATTCKPGDVPDLDAFKVSEALMSWELTLETNVELAAVEEVFEFVDGLCTLEITPVDDPDEATTADTSDPSNSAGAPDPATLAPVPAGTTDTTATQKDNTAPMTETATPLAAAGAPVSNLAAATLTAPEKPTEKATAGGATASPRQTVRVDLERIDRLVNLVGELVINQAMLGQSVAAAGLSNSSQISTGLDEFMQLTRDIQDSVMMIRAQPVKSLFQRMARIVREGATATGKQARLKTEGEATEIDKTMIERLADPLTHMIRNAIDHGLEDTEKRVTAGKSPEGTVTLAASHKSGRVNIVVSDDGGGINREKVRSIAESKGLIQPGQDLTTSEVDNLLFLPGFSTADKVSNLSGRGVGMDVVKNAITALGGRVSIQSSPGEGTIFTISLPLTLAVLDGMVIRVGQEMLVVPLNAISETLSLTKDDIRPLGPHKRVVQVRETFVPILDLGHHLGYTGPRDSFEGAIVLLIAQEDGSRAALVVDSIEDQRQVVIKGLQEGYGRVPGVAAATILGDGQIALILDPTDLLSNPAGPRGAPMLQAS